jgi:hypothetical protein
MISMSKDLSKWTIPQLIENYKKSTMDYYSACDAENFAKQKSTGSRVNQIVQRLDSYGAEGRLALIPLLDDADQGIRTFAAADLLKVIPDRAIAVLKEIEKGPTYFPRLSAGSFLDSYTKGKWGR